MAKPAPGLGNTRQLRKTTNPLSKGSSVPRVGMMGEVAESETDDGTNDRDDDADGTGVCP